MGFHLPSGHEYIGFKPYYNWNTFNTKNKIMDILVEELVLNLIITGIPSIRFNNSSVF